MASNQIPDIIRIEITSWLRFAIYFLIIIALGFVIINQGLGFFYKAHFLKAPCELCSELNPEVKTCIDNINSPRPSFPDGNGGWSDPFSTDDT